MIARVQHRAIAVHMQVAVSDHATREGMLDEDLLKTFIEAKVFHLVGKE